MHGLVEPRKLTGADGAATLGSMSDDVETRVMVPTAEVGTVSEDPDRGYAVARATQEVAARAARARSGFADRKAVERAREVVAHALYCAGLDAKQIPRVMAEGRVGVEDALGGQVTRVTMNGPITVDAPLVERYKRHVATWIGLERDGAPTVGEARTAVTRMLAVVEHSRDGRAWYGRRDQHVAELHEIKRMARDQGNVDGALKAMAAVARIEGFDAPQKSVNLHGHAMIGPNTTTSLPDGPGVVAGVSVQALRAMGRDGREMLVKLIGIAEVARAELPAAALDDDGNPVDDAEIVDGADGY